MLENALVAGITSLGVDVLLIGPLPTPGVAYITRSLRADAGIVLSASHNPYEDNGIKFFRHDGYKLDDEVEQQIEQLVFAGEIDSIRTDRQENRARHSHRRRARALCGVCQGQFSPRDVARENAESRSMWRTARLTNRLPVFYASSERR
jgi:phosphomannomutase